MIVISLIAGTLVPAGKFPAFLLTPEDSAAIEKFINSFEEEKTLPDPVKLNPVDIVSYGFRDFDPNSVTLVELTEMGIPPKLGKNIIRYREAGGRFRKKTDLKKIYGFTDSIFKACEEFILIAEKTKPDTISAFRLPDMKVELNSADSTDLLGLSGIGPYFAGKIIDYRDKLGGIVNIGQLLEIRGMDSSKIEKFRNNLIIDSLAIITINLNTCTPGDLANHPYLSKRQAEAIIKYRLFAGSIRNIDELKTNRILTEQSFDKLKPYFTVEN